MTRYVQELLFQLFTIPFITRSRNEATLPMPRKSPRKAKSPEVEDVDYSPPTKKKWDDMLRYGSFQVADENGKLHKFTREDTATILPYGRPPGTNVDQSEYWVGTILEIKASDVVDEERSTDVWAKVQWWYSAQDAADIVRTFDPSKCSPYERVWTDGATDIVSSQAFNEVIEMKWLEDDNLDQPYIGSDEFYTRYRANLKARRLTPKPGASSCTCGEPYAYSEPTVMHFCPRPSCRKWYHQTCLVDAGSLLDATSLPPEKSPRKSKRGRPSAPKNEPVSPLLLTSPDTNTSLDLSTPRAVRPTKRRRISTRSDASMSPQKGDVIVEDPLEDSDPDDGDLGRALAKLPKKLVQLASQPIVRGSLFKTGGVSGNVQPVVRARRLVHGILGLEEDDADRMNVEHSDDSTKVGQGEAPDDWEERALGSEPEVNLNDCVVKIEGSKKGIPLLACPECGSAI